MSRDGQYFAAAGEKSLRLYDAHTFRERVRLKKPQRVWSLSFSPDARLLSVDEFYAFGAGVSIWDIGKAQVVTNLPVNGVNAAFSPDGRWLVTGSTEEYCFWQVGSWKPDHTVQRSTLAGTYSMIAFSPDARMVAVTDSQQSVRLLDPATGGEFATLTSPQPANMIRLCFSPDSQHLATTSTGNGVQLWDLHLIRQQLAAMKLDWDLPSFPTAVTNEWNANVKVIVLSDTNAPRTK